MTGLLWLQGKAGKDSYKATKLQSYKATRATKLKAAKRAANFGYKGGIVSFAKALVRSSQALAVAIARAWQWLLGLTRLALARAEMANCSVIACASLLVFALLV